MRTRFDHIGFLMRFDLSADGFVQFLRKTLNARFDAVVHADALSG